MQDRFPKGDIVRAMRDLNAKIGSNNTLLGHAIEKDGLGDRNDNDWRCVDF